MRSSLPGFDRAWAEAHLAAAQRLPPMARGWAERVVAMSVDGIQGGQIGWTCRSCGGGAAPDQACKCGTRLSVEEMLQAHGLLEAWGVFGFRVRRPDARTEPKG